MRFFDRTGVRYGRLTAVSVHSKRNNQHYWNCVCDCGKTTVVQGSSLTVGDSRSCGCYNDEVRRRDKADHQDGKPGKVAKEFKAWVGMKQRCHNSKNPGYKNYGGRGISVCQEWRDSYLSFLDHIGRAPSEKHSVDRIDNNGNYEPGNVRWATRTEQMSNRRNSIKIEYNGHLLPIVDLARKYNIPYSRLLYQYKNKMNFKSILK